MTGEKPKRVWDNCQLIGEINKSESKKFVVELVARDGIKFINVREWYKKKSESIWRPDRAGIAIPVAMPVNKGKELIMPTIELVNMIREALALSTDFAIEDEDNAVWFTPKPKDKDNG